MNYYQKHIGDFNNATRHLTRVERSLYQDAIELYYSTEKPLITDIDKLARLLLANTEEEINALGVVLDEFFVRTDTGYFNNRCNKEIEKYQGYIENQSKAGKASAKQRSNVSPSDVEPSLNKRASNHKPITTNQEPLTKRKESTKEKTSILFSLTKRKVEEQVAKDWIKLRNTQKAPVTNTVIRTFVLEADKAKLSLNDVLIVCIEKSWRGFKADWLTNFDGNGEDKPTGPDWRYDNNLIKEKGVELGVPMNQGENLKDYRGRLIMVYGDKP